MQAAGELAQLVQHTTDLGGDPAVLMDVIMPNMCGLEAAHVLTQQRPGVHVPMFSADVHCSVVRAAVDAGATGFLAKGSTGSDLVRAIRAADEGRTTWPASA